MTAKSSFCDWGGLYKSGVYAVKVLCLTLGDLHGSGGAGLRGRETYSEHRAEVSRGHSRGSEPEGPNDEGEVAS